MSAKVVCDGCGKERGKDEDWFGVYRSAIYETKGNYKSPLLEAEVELDFCSWECLARIADRRFTEERARRPSVSDGVKAGTGA